MNESTKALLTDDLNCDNRMLRKYLSPSAVEYNAGIWTLLTEVLDYLGDHDYLSDRLTRMDYRSPDGHVCRFCAPPTSLGADHE